MRALYYVGPEQVEMREAEELPLAEGESRVRIQATGICGSDLHAFHGHDPRRKPPLILGHEAAGEVIEGPLLGKRVTMNPLIICGHCDYCMEGRQNLCANRTMIGMTRPGSFAETLTIPSHCLIELPDSLSAEAAALTEPAATALHGVNRLAACLPRPLSEGRVLVIGGGAIGLLTALILRHKGVRHLQVAETNLPRRNTAEKAGLTAFDPRSEAPEADAFDAVFDCVGSAPTRQMAVHCIRPGGAIMHLGLQDNEGSLDTRAITLKEVAFLGAYTYTSADLRATVDLLDSQALGELSWVEVRQLEDGDSAFADLVAGRTPAAKVILKPHG